MHVCKHGSIYGPKCITGCIRINDGWACVCVKCVELSEHCRRQQENINQIDLTVCVCQLCGLWVAAVQYIHGGIFSEKAAASEGVTLQSNF